MTGSAVQWLRDQLGIIASAREIEALATSVPDNGGIYFVPAFSGLFAPYWRSDARGAIVGLSRFNTKAHLARATLEAICFQTRAVLDAMVKDSGVRLAVLKVDGGATVNDTLMQLQADSLACPSCARSWRKRPRSARPTPPGWRPASGRISTTFGRTGRWTVSGSRSGAPTSATPRTRAGRRPSNERSIGRNSSKGHRVQDRSRVQVPGTGSVSGGSVAPTRH